MGEMGEIKIGFRVAWECSVSESLREENGQKFKLK